MRVLLPWGKKKKKNDEDDPVRMAMRKELAVRDAERKKKTDNELAERRKRKLFGNLSMAKQRQLKRYLERNKTNVKK